MTGRLQDKVCIITGTGGTLGAACAKLFAEQGAKIVGCDINAESARECVETVTAAGGAMVSLEPLDLTDPRNAERLVELALTTYGRIDVVLNVASAMIIGWIEDFSAEDFTAMMAGEVNLVFYLNKAAWPALKQQGGAIVNVASASAWMCYEVLPGLAHSSGKAAVVSMTRHLAMEGRTHGIRANSISPGLIDTPATRHMIATVPGWKEAMVGKVMLGRAGQPAEIAAAALFLASDESSFITATDIRVDGGTTAW